jgi:hypothetical protein
MERIVKAFNLPIPEGAVSCNSTCSITGEQIKNGFPIEKIISKDTSDIFHIFKVHSGFISVYAAAVFRAQTVIRGNIMVWNGTGIRPFVSVESATKERPCWSDLFKKMENGDEIYAIVTDESKRRLWPNAMFCNISENTKIYFNGSPYKGAALESRLLCLNYKKFLECLDSVEKAYEAGFSKASIFHNLLSTQNRKFIQATGIRYAKDVEKQLMKWRCTDEFVLSVFVAQKNGGKK